MRTQIPVRAVEIQMLITISIEANDVATCIRWSLLSASVVLMPPSTKT
jgi:hypothetical protein